MSDQRLILVGAVLSGLFLVIAGRFFQLQVLEGARWAGQVERSRLVTEILPARRGRILDRNGAPLADTRTVLSAAVVFEDLELAGRARRKVPILRLDPRRFDALLADLTGRVRLAAGTSLRELVEQEFTAHPATAVRTLPTRGDGRRIALLAVPRTALAPQRHDPFDESDPGLLTESDLLREDPVEALSRELEERWRVPVAAVPDDEVAAACTALDQSLDLGGEPAAKLLEPFLPRFTIDLGPSSGGPRRLTLRLVTDDAIARGLGALIRLADQGTGPELALHQVRDRWQRSLAEAQARRVVPSASVLYAASCDADGITPRLPTGSTLAETVITRIPGERERILLLQGDAPGGDGCWSTLSRRVAADLGLEPTLLQSLVERHAEVITPAKAQEQTGTWLLVLDPRRLDRLADGLAQTLTTAGRPTTRLVVDRLLAQARRIADRAWAGQTKGDPIPLIDDLPPGVAARLDGRDAEPPADLLQGYGENARAEAVATLPGLVLRRTIGRAWPLGDTLCHTLGIIGPDPQGDGAPVGKWGLEATYDTTLRGLPGRRIRLRTPEGEVVVRDDPPFDGRDLVTEIDAEIQVVAEDSLERQLDLARDLGTSTNNMEAAHAVGRGRAGFVLLDCTTGGILAMASNPRFTYDQLSREFERISTDPAQPLLDYAANPSAPPGSSFKILTALACLEYGVITPGQEISSPGYVALINGQKYIRDHAPEGTYNLQDAIMASSNVYFALIGAKLGPTRLTEIAWKVGLGRRNALDVFQQPAANPRFLPTPANLPLIRPREPKWIRHDTWRTAIGQNAMASPLQCAPIAAAVANGGHIVSPYLVRPATIPKLEDLHIREAWLDEVRQGMEAVTSQDPRATAKLLVLQGTAAGNKVAAKTGTAEWGSAGSRSRGTTPDHGWMIGYAPADRPTVAFACFVHSGTSGGNSCTPVVKKVLETYFAKFGRQGHEGEDQ